MGCEDVLDHDRLREDPLIATLCEQVDVEGRRRQRDRGRPLSGKSTLNRLETGVPAVSRYKQIGWDEAAIGGTFVEVFLSSFESAPQQIVLDLDTSHDPLHGHQEGRFSTATMTATAICHCTSSATITCCAPR